MSAFAGKPWARPHDNGRRDTCDRCGDNRSALQPGPGPKLCAKCRVETSTQRAIILKDGSVYDRGYWP